MIGFCFSKISFIVLHPFPSQFISLDLYSPLRPQIVSMLHYLTNQKIYIALGNQLRVEGVWNKMNPLFYGNCILLSTICLLKYFFGGRQSDLVSTKL